MDAVKEFQSDHRGAVGWTVRRRSSNSIVYGIQELGMDRRRFVGGRRVDVGKWCIDRRPRQRRAGLHRVDVFAGEHRIAMGADF